MKTFALCVAGALLGAFAALGSDATTNHNSSYPLWDLALSQTNVQRFDTLFTAQDVRDHLANDAAIDEAIDWCKRTGITHVFLEVYRDSYRAEPAMLKRAKARFLAAGFEVSGGVTTTQIGKPSTGWASEISCYTDQPTQQKLQEIFEYAASLFNEVIIDDFYFTDCACRQCQAACRARVVTIGDKRYPVSAANGPAYRCELMLRMAQDRILAASKRINPKVKIILKFPQWYDDFQNRGYDVTRESAAFDGIWVGTETRDFDDPKWGGVAPDEGYFLLRWLSGIAGEKCGGGWYDYLGTSPATYIEQARQTILAGARESFLFHYGALCPLGPFDVVAGFHSPNGPSDIEALRQNMPELFSVAAKVSHRPILGVAAYKPPGSPPGDDPKVFDFVGMMGVPLAPCHEFPSNAPAAFFSEQALADPFFTNELAAFLKTGRPIMVTDGLARRLSGSIDLTATNIETLAVSGEPDMELALTQPEVETLRRPLLAALHTVFHAPNHVGLYLYDNNGWAVENFNGMPVEVELNGKSFEITARGWKYSL